MNTITNIEQKAAPLRWAPILGLLAAFVVPMLALSAYAWFQLPTDAQIPTHWDIHGQVNGHAPKGVGLFLLPGLLLFIVPLIVGLVRLDPRRQNVAASQPFLFVTLAGLMLLFAGIHVAMIAICLGRAVPMNLVVMTLVGGLFAAMGLMMGRVKSNFFMGVRTPWTLSSELSWKKTHALTGRLFLATGVATILTAWIIGPTVATGLLIAGSFVSSIGAVIYSYFQWKADPNVSPSAPAA